MKLATIGYQSRTQAELIETLQAAQVRTLIDVRAVAASRRAGFSKKLLAASLDEAGIRYVHLPQLGTPKPGRDAARAGRVAEMHRIFEAHMADPAALAQLGLAAEIARESKSALLCLEAEARVCHRSILSDRLSTEYGFEVEDL